MKLRWIATALMTTSLAALSACSGQPGPTDSVPGSASGQALAADPTPVAPPKAAPDDAKHARGKRGPHGAHGPSMLLHVAERELELTDAQKKTLTDAREKAEQGLSSLRDDERAIDKKLAAALRAGEVDAASIKAEIDALGKKMSDRAKTHVEALETLHATLTPEQRKQLVENVRARAGEKERRGPPPGVVPNDHNDRMQKGERAGKRGERRGPFADLDLTDAQRAAFDKALGPKPGPDERSTKLEQHKKRMDALLLAFANDHFDADAHIDSRDFAKHPSEHLTRQLELTKVAITVLDPDQRTRLAERMEKGPMRGGPGRKH